MEYPFGPQIPRHARRRMNRRKRPAAFNAWRILAAACAALTVALGTPAFAEPPPVKAVNVQDGITLHYVEHGSGEPVVLVHGSLSDGGYWSDVLETFGEHYHVFAYSRRYNWPNVNPVQAGYSAIVDADDLAALVKKLGLGRVHVIGHSYGALTALFFAIRHPEAVRTLVLTEAPAVSLLGYMQGDRAEIGKATLADIQARMVSPMQQAFRRGDREGGIRAFMAYVFRDPLAWDKMSFSAREDTLKNGQEWDAMMTSGELFPALDPTAVQQIKVPVLLLSGQRSYPFLSLIDSELEALLPHVRRIIVPDATHQMWLEQPAVCRTAVLDFWHRLYSLP